MDCVEGALKSSFGPDPSKKTPNHPFSDDSSTVNGQSGVSGDDFFVDDLLDFSEGGIEDGFCEVLVKEENGDGFCGVVKEEKEEENKEETEVQNKKDSPPSRSTNNFSVIDDFPSLPCTELSVPVSPLSLSLSLWKFHTLTLGKLGLFFLRTGLQKRERVSVFQKYRKLLKFVRVRMRAGVLKRLLVFDRVFSF